MIIEAMGFLIVIGAAILYFVHRHNEAHQQPAKEQEALMVSAEQLKQEMERSANEIIQRMGSHVTHLEQVIREAEEKKHALDLKLVELQGAEQSLSRQLSEGRAFQQQMDFQQKQCQMLYRQMSEASLSSMQKPVVFEQPKESRAESADVQQFSDILSETIRKSEEDAFPHDTYEPMPVQDIVSVNTTAEVGASRKETSAENPSERARALLTEGWSVVDVARETGMGRGAVELLYQMLQRRPV